MRKKCILLSLAMVLFVTNPGFSQMIKYDRLNKNNRPGASQSRSSESPPVEVVRKQEYPVVNRDEKVYDLNGDELLQEAEIQEFFKDVVATVLRRGMFPVNSDLLGEFDNDKDGKITRYEIGQIRERIN